jgi:hypothetical protein
MLFLHSRISISVHIGMLVLLTLPYQLLWANSPATYQKQTLPYNTSPFRELEISSTHPNPRTNTPVSNGSEGLPALKSPVVSLPAGTTFTVSIQHPISSQVNKVGDTIEAKLETPLTAENKLVLPKGSLLKGKIIGVRSAGGAIRSGSIRLQFTSITPTDTGLIIPLQAKIKTPSGSGVLEGEGFKSNAAQIATKTAIGAATGAAAGSLNDLLRHNNTNTKNGIIMGASIGAAVGLIHSLLQTKPQPIELEANTPLTLVLEQLLTINNSRYIPSQIVLPPYTPQSSPNRSQKTYSSEPNTTTGYYGY